MDQLKRFPPYLGGLLLRVLWAILVGVLLLTAVRLLPAGPAERNLASSAAVFREEGEYPSLFPWCTSRLDSTTDALILMISAWDTGESPLVQAMTGSHPVIAGPETPSQQLARRYGDGLPFTGTEPYYQYWHGYQLFIRPLLSILDYSGIRLLNGLVQTALLIWLCLLLRRSGLGRYILPYLAAVAMVMPPVTAMSLQFSSCYYILTLACIFLMLRRDTLDRTDGPLFLSIGIATAYFDFLTYPAATLGIPAVLYFCLTGRRNIRDTFCRGVKLCFAWALGYGGMWAGKWVAGSLILRQNILSLAADKLAERSLSNPQSHSLLYNIRAALSANVRSFLDTPVTLAVLALACVLAAVVLRRLASKKVSPGSVLTTLFPFVVIAALPAVWYVVTAQHATIHYWFTCRALMVSVFAALAGLTKAALPPIS